MKEINVYATTHLPEFVKRKPQTNMSHETRTYHHVIVHQCIVHIVTNYTY